MEELEEVEIEEEVRSMEESSRIRTEGIVEEVKREVIESRYEITILRLRNTDSEGETHVILKRADEETNYQWEEGHILSISGLHPQKIDGREYLMSSPTTKVERKERRTREINSIEQVTELIKYFKIDPESTEFSLQNMLEWGVDQSSTDSQTPSLGKTYPLSEFRNLIDKKLTLVGYIKGIDLKKTKKRHIGLCIGSLTSMDEMNITLRITRGENSEATGLIVGDVIAVTKLLRRVNSGGNIVSDGKYTKQNVFILGKLSYGALATMYQKNIYSLKVLFGIPHDRIVRHRIKIMGSITKVRFLQISLKCLKHHDTKSCTPKCKEDKDLKIKCYCLLADATGKAFLQINEEIFKSFLVVSKYNELKNNCKTYGVISYTENAKNEIISKDIALKLEGQLKEKGDMLLYCIPFMKLNHNEEKVINEETPMIDIESKIDVYPNGIVQKNTDRGKIVEGGGTKCRICLHLAQIEGYGPNFA